MRSQKLVITKLFHTSKILVLLVWNIWRVAQGTTDCLWVLKIMASFVDPSPFTPGDHKPAINES